MSINLPVEHFFQYTNIWYPQDSCAATCITMVMKYYGYPGTHNEIKDKLYTELEQRGLHRQNGIDLAEVFNILMKDVAIDNFTMQGRIEDVKRTLENQNPVVVHTQLTTQGHIILLRGYDETGFWVNDPYGEWFPDGYRTDLNGENLHYSYDLINQTVFFDPGQTGWVHLFHRI
ncbi:C39 family peptidase [Planktothrix sp.]|uniref:C39 family peptidase n=2 Tax=Planktothrix sp. TaxID=3088171 RepID=UPI0038D3AB46